MFILLRNGFRVTVVRGLVSPLDRVLGRVRSQERVLAAC